MSNANQHQPYRLLGNQLRRLREKNLQSLAEVSGAVEIETTTLLDYENGLKRPSEDILLLLISHFAAKEQEATELWEMAGYSKMEIPTIQLSGDDLSGVKPIIMVMPIDNRIIYSDMVNVKVNDTGVVMNFLQNSGPNTQALPVARIGMSLEQTRIVLEVLKHSLAQAEQSYTQKALPEPKPKLNDPEPLS